MPNPEDSPFYACAQTMLNDEIVRQFNTHLEKITIFQDEDLNKPAEIILSGRLKISRRTKVDMELVKYKYDGEETIILRVGESRYYISSYGVVPEDSGDYCVDDEELLELRSYVKKTRWAKAKDISRSDDERQEF